MKTKNEKMSAVRTRAGRIGSAGRWVRSLATCGVGAALCASLVGCGASAEDLAADELLTETREQDIHSDLWKNWGSIGAAPTAIDTNPGLCANKAYIYNVFVRDTNFNFRAKTQISRFGFSAWSSAIGSTQFWSSPACAMLYPSLNTDNVMLLAGKAFDNRIKVQLLTQDSTASATDPPQPPTQTAWGQLSSTQYTGGSNGFPAVAANGSRAVLTFRNGSTIYAHHRIIPFTSQNPWGSRVSAPALPSGVTPSGVPAITYAGGLTNAFVVMVKTNDGLYWITNNGSSFGTSWSRAFVPYTVASDPAIEWTDYDSPNDDVPRVQLFSLYFVDDTGQVLQTSVVRPGDLGAQPFYHINSDATILGTPAVVFGGALESGIRTALVRGYTSSTPAADRNKTVLWAEDIYPWQ